ncbi:hypothetical protein [Nocardia sp. CA-135398]|uniref:hypothetical protein n=1 Tax=Nocardia sp. CA-135398 TaxID=3239977 RepID=UPI003D9655E2
MASDPALTLPEVQTVMRHRHLSTTEVYLQSRVEELHDKLAEHYVRPRQERRFAADYAAEDIAAVFGAVPDQHWRQLLDHATTAEPDQLMALDGSTYRRLFTQARRARIARHGEANIRVRAEHTGKAIDLSLKEDAAFWEWAVIETFRHSGLRCEELLELSQLSIRQYQRPNGEVIALLVIAPSKTYRERVIPMSAQLFHVIACIIRRLTKGRKMIPLATRYDSMERVTLPRWWTRVDGYC